MKHLYTLFIICATLLPDLAAGNNKSDIGQLFAKCEQARSLSQYQALTTYSEQLIDQAEACGDSRALTYAYFYNGLGQLFSGNTDSSMARLEEAENLAMATKNDSVRALVLNAYGIYHAMVENNTFVAQQYFFRSLELAEKTDFTELNYRVKGNLLTLSHSMGDSMALTNAREVYDYGVQHKNMEQAAMGAYFLAAYYYEHENDSQTEKYLQQALNIYNTYPYEDIASIYVLYAKMLIRKGDTPRAEQMLERAMDMVRQYQQLSLRVDVNITYAELLQTRHDYAQSVERLKSAMAEADSIGITNKVIDCNQLIAKSYIAMGHNTEALQHLQQANELLSNQATINLERLSHEQRIMRDIQQREMDMQLKQEQITSQRIMLLLLGIIVVVLVTLLLVGINYYRRRNMLYKKIVLQNTRAMARQKELQEQIEALEEKKADAEPDEATAPAPVSEKEGFALDKDKMNRLYASLCRLMETERLFTEAQLTREKLAERLGTNRTYLTLIIKEKTNMNYLQYINSYRINEAIRILSDKDKTDYPMKRIWSDLGFSSPSTFYKLFQQAVGITPTTYRKQFLQVNHEEENAKEDNLV